MPHEMHPYAAGVFADLSARTPWEVDFLQAVREVFVSISPLLEQNPRFRGNRILERLVEPERVIAYRVPWTDDRNDIQVHRGWRVQFNSALGPYKGGLRFHASVSLSTLKFLAFEQTLKNALTGMPIGGAKGGADFQFRGRSETELMRFCQSFMTELHRHIGPDIDVPAGDIGVGTRELGYLFGHYKRLTRSFHGVLTGKGLLWGGSLLRPEATGYGVAYFAAQVLAAAGESLSGKKVAVSGFGNVAWGTVAKLTDLGARVVTLSGPDGFVHDPDGVTGEKINYMLEMRRGSTDAVRAYADKFRVEFHADRRPWGVPCDLAVPCAIQNELNGEDAAALAAGGCRWVIEGANMPCTADAVERLRANAITYVPGKASNAGGVAVSALEMAQNRTGDYWSAARVDAALHDVMRRIHDVCADTATAYGRPGDYAFGANVGGFARVADAMLDHGVV